MCRLNRDGPPVETYDHPAIALASEPRINAF